ncbi:hypothetical protein [Glycomyces rhizosphaerae]|uniref:Uncharacterized protein n=1 Tax=Glycomyces rhizosphaerae TaxID=2054422 RepID=A0ABV7Q7P9_9ACTN
MTYPQDGRPQAPSNRRAQTARPHRPEPSPGPDDPYPSRRHSQRFNSEGVERRSGSGRPASASDSAPTAGYYSAATPQRPLPRAGHAASVIADERPRGNPAGAWTDPYPDQRRGNTATADRKSDGRGSDDDWDTQVFSLLPNRAAAGSDGRADRIPPSSRTSFLDEAPDSGDPRDNARLRTEAKLARQVAAIASLAAGVVHVFATPTHWEEWLLAGAFFAATAAFQLLWGLLALPLGNALIRVTGLLANVGFLGVWAVSRVWGVPFGPHAGVPESFGAADLIAAAMEVAVVVGLAWSLLPRERHGVLSAGGYRAVVVLAFVALGALAVPGASAALEHSHSHDAESTGEEDDGHDHEHGSDENMDMESPADSESTADPETEATEPTEDHTHAPGEEHE